MLLQCFISLLYHQSITGDFGVQTHNTKTWWYKTRNSGKWKGITEGVSYHYNIIVETVYPKNVPTNLILFSTTKHYGTILVNKANYNII